MNRARTMLQNRLIVGGSAVALVLIKTVLWIYFCHFAYVSVPAYLSKY